MPADGDVAREGVEAPPHHQVGELVEDDVDLDAPVGRVDQRVLERLTDRVALPDEGLEEDPGLRLPDRVEHVAVQVLAVGVDGDLRAAGGHRPRRDPREGRPACAAACGGSRPRPARAGWRPAQRSRPGRTGGARGGSGSFATARIPMYAGRNVRRPANSRPCRRPASRVVATMTASTTEATDDRSCAAYAGPARPAHPGTAARGAQPAAARGGAARGRPGAGRGRRRVGQDPGADPPDRLPGQRAPGASRLDPGHHLHQQGRGRDARPGDRPGRQPGQADVGLDLPLGLRADPASRDRPVQHHPDLLHLRRRRLQAADAAGRARPRPGRRSGSRSGRS